MPSLKTTSVEDLAQATVSCFALWITIPTKIRRSMGIFSAIPYLPRYTPTCIPTYLPNPNPTYIILYIYIHTCSALPTGDAWPIFTSHTSAFSAQVSGINSYAHMLIYTYLHTHLPIYILAYAPTLDTPTYIPTQCLRMHRM